MIPSNIAQISCGAINTKILTVDGKVFAVGANFQAQLMDGTLINKQSKKFFNLLTNFSVCSNFGEWRKSYQN